MSYMRQKSRLTNSSKESLPEPSLSNAFIMRLTCIANRRMFVHAHSLAIKRCHQLERGEPHLGVILGFDVHDGQEFL